MSLEWLDWEEDEDWNLYAVTMSSIITDEQLGPMWPIYTTSLDKAITIYQVLLNMRGEDH